MANNNMEQFIALSKNSIQEQAKIFLRAFVLDFQGNFEEVLESALEFEKYAPKPEEGQIVTELEADAAHRFLEKHGDTRTVKQLRDEMKDIDVDANTRISFLEYALWKYKKRVKDLVSPPGSSNDPALLKKLEEAISAFEGVLSKRKAREQKMAELADIAAKGGVKGLAAKNELDQMQQEDQLAQNKNELSAAANKRKAQKALNTGVDREKALKEEQQRLEREKKKKDEEEAKKKAEARARLAAKAKMFEQNDT